MKLVLRIFTFMIFTFKCALEGKHGAHTSNPALGRQKQKDQEFKANLVYKCVSGQQGLHSETLSNNEQTN